MTVVWETPNPRGWKMSHASVVPMEIGGRKTYVYGALGGMVGVAADGPDAGAVLWETSEWNPSVAAPSPVHLGDGQVGCYQRLNLIVAKGLLCNGHHLAHALHVGHPPGGDNQVIAFAIHHRNKHFVQKRNRCVVRFGVLFRELNIPVKLEEARQPHLPSACCLTRN